MQDTIRELEPAEIDLVYGGEGQYGNGEVEPGTNIWSNWWWPWVDVNGTPPPGLGG